ncbi:MULTISPECIES: BadF/BadG/BcrA/BcrD ATPase family protein [unclassified Streptomyces]|uniref:N-acetylglucosamine kinase n=1 Tax=unclassified Streptomyces TaxID=2593676 RepID=UPI001F04BF27|nr:MULTISPECIES: BadF/BadG/BcrA/BcrD ATPase family protein [unclassified Streptomyces]MCH0562423.1 ATPase [Streptomyces sp. MUM 2J]MCH0570399.1 ATPase [Streptomyces sp. MUM 136J]
MTSGLPQAEAGPSAGRDTGFLAVDSGGSGLRVAVGTARRGVLGQRSTAQPVPTGARGVDADHLMERLVPLVEALTVEAGAPQPSAAVVGAAGLGTLGDALRAELPGALRRAFGVRRLALAADAVTAYCGALGSRPGAVIAAGTGLIAVGTDLVGWRRADGWGHLLGDCGSGAWIGRAGLEAALRAHDGRPGGSAGLLARAEEAFGPVQVLPGRLYPRADRPAVLASFAPRVAGCAADGDQVAVGILATAARHMAESACAVCPAGGEPLLALTGGLFRMGEPLLAPLARELARLLPHARRVPAAGDPLNGAVRLATDLATGPLALPADGQMLQVVATERG